MNASSDYALAVITLIMIAAVILAIEYWRI